MLTASIDSAIRPTWMRKPNAWVVTVIPSFTVAFQLAAEERISPSKAAKYIGKKATVCEQVASATYAARSRGRLTFPNLHRPLAVHDVVGRIKN